jgi:hypothetical protein
MQSGGNRLRSLVADFVAALQNSSWPSRTPMKKQTRIHQHPQNSSYKVQLLHAAVLMKSGGNRLRSLVADFDAALQNSCWPSRTPMKKQTRIQH